MSVATTGLACIHASRMHVGWPSAIEGSTNTSALAVDRGQLLFEKAPEEKHLIVKMHLRGKLPQFPFGVAASRQNNPNIGESEEGFPGSPGSSMRSPFSGSV